MRTARFHTGEPPWLTIRNTSGEIALETVDGDETVVELVALDRQSEEAVELATVEQRGDEIVVELPERRMLRVLVVEVKVRVTIRCPHGARARVKTVSADTDARGLYAEFELNGVSGDVRIEQVEGAARVKTVSGDVHVGPVARDGAFQTVSGDLTVERVGGAAELRSVSGDVRLDAAGGPVTAQTVSGDQLLRSVAHGAVQCKSVSGDVIVGVAPGSRVWVDAKSLSGSTRSELDLADAPAGDDGPLVEIRANALSGDIRLTRAG